MKMKQLGAIGTVTGSCTLCIHEETGTEFLVDCGMMQGAHQEFEMRQPFEFDPRRIKFVLLTHAHMDHCGMLPILRARGFTGKIYCTTATMRLTQAQLQDCYQNLPQSEQVWVTGLGYVQQLENKARSYLSYLRKKEKVHAGAQSVDDSLQAKEDSSQNNKGKKQKKMPPLDANEIWRQTIKEMVRDLPFEPLDDRRKFQTGKLLPVSDDLWVSPLRSSHMLGASSYSIGWKLPDGSEKSIFFSGDVGSSNGDLGTNGAKNHLPLLRENHVAHLRTDYIVCESTYGNAPPRDDSSKNFEDRINELSKIVSGDRFDTVILPCFAMQRAQDVLVDLFYLHHQGRLSSPTTVYVDSAMAEKFCWIFRDSLKKTNGAKFKQLAKEFAERFGPGDSNLSIAQCEELLDQIFAPMEGANFNVVFCNEKRKLEQGSNGGAANIIPFEPKGRRQIIVTSSGMCHAGRVLEHLPRLKREATALVLTGYQAMPNGQNLRALVSGKDGEAVDTPHFLLDLGLEKKHGNGKNGGNSNGDQKPIRSGDIKGRVFNMSPYYSGHADKETILDFLFMLEKKVRDKHTYKKDAVVFLNHGDNEARRALRMAILARTGEKRMDDSRKIHRVETPHKNSPFFDLDKGEWEEPGIDAAIRQLLRALGRK